MSASLPEFRSGFGHPWHLRLENNIVATETLTLESKAHDLIGQLNHGKLAAVVHLLEVMVHDTGDEDGELTPELHQRLLDSQADFANGGKGIPMEEVLADFGLTMDDFPRPHHD